MYTGGAHVKRYHCLAHQLQLIYTTRNSDFSRCPNICKYIDLLSERVTCKEVAQGKHPLYSLHRPRKSSIFEKRSKILGVITEDEIIVGLDKQRTYATDGLYLFSLQNERLTKYVMGILNSRLFVFLYRKLAIEKGRVLAQVKPTLLAHLPIRSMDMQCSVDKKILDEMNDLVDSIMKICEQTSMVSNPVVLNQSKTLKRAIDRRIDRIVYNIYDLSDEDVQVIEASTATQS